MRRILATLLVLFIPAAAPAATAPHTTYLWHMHQPVYWPDRSTWTPYRYETAYETITLGHSESDVFTIFNKDDRVGDYQRYPRDAILSVTDHAHAGAQISLAGSLIENLFSLGDNGWNGGKYAPDWYRWYREARAWITSGGQRRLDLVLVGHHHPILPLVPEAAVRKEIQVQKAAWQRAWGAAVSTRGFFPAETCFSERLIPALVAEGIEWCVVPDLHIARACANYPYLAHEDNCDPPNPADQTNPPQGYFHNMRISRGVNIKVPPAYGWRPHRARYVDPATGVASSLIVVPSATAMSWNEGYGLYGTGEIDAVAPYNDPAHPMLFVLTHDGDNDWAGGYSYYYENVNQFCDAAAARGYEPGTIERYLAGHAPEAGDIVHVEDGGWPNADGDFGSPEFLNWNWPLVGATGQVNIPGGWAEDERNWAVLVAAENWVETAEQIAGPSDAADIHRPSASATDLEKAWHFLLAGYESGYMYYGTALDFEVKATLAVNAAYTHAEPIVAGGNDYTGPTVWIPQRYPWNPGGYGGGALWGYPSGAGAPAPSNLYVWTFAHDVHGIATAVLKHRTDDDGANDPATDVNETYAGGAGVGAWNATPMTRRVFPAGNFHNDPNIDFFVLPERIADEYYAQLIGFEDVLVDYYVEMADSLGNVTRTPIQHVWFGGGAGGAGFVMDGELDASAQALASSGALTLWAAYEEGVLYVAAPSVAATAGADHFILVSTGFAASPVSAPWAKAGTVASRRFHLAQEDANFWRGWFDSLEAVRTDAPFASATGTVLEGTLDLEALLGAAPAQVYLAFATYASPDGGALGAQAPAGNGNGNVESGEYVAFALGTVGVPEEPPPAPALVRAYPNPARGEVVFDVAAADGECEIVIFDPSGRIVRRLAASPGPRVWDGRDAAGRPAAAGVYLARAGAGRATRVLLLR
jgi:hypothetical protein